MDRRLHKVRIELGTFEQVHADGTLVDWTINKPARRVCLAMALSSHITTTSDRKTEREVTCLLLTAVLK